MAATVGAEMWLTLSSSQLVYTCTNISCNQPPTTTPSTAPSSQGTFSSTNASHASFPVDMGPSKYPGNLVPSGAIPQWLPKRQIIREIRNKRPLLDYLLPICLKLEFKPLQTGASTNSAVSERHFWTHRYQSWPRAVTRAKSLFTIESHSERSFKDSFLELLPSSTHITPKLRNNLQSCPLISCASKPENEALSLLRVSFFFLQEDENEYSEGLDDFAEHIKLMGTYRSPSESN
jgi:hypothetical protein